MKPFETIYIDTKTIACNGGGALGHPKIYLNTGTEGRVECPYCSRVYVFGREEAEEHRPREATTGEA